MNRLATLGFGLALCGVFSACGSDGGTSSSEDNNPEFESGSSAGENLSSSQNLITSSATETLSSAEVVNLSSSAVDESGSSAESVGSSSSVFNKSSSSVSSGSNPAGDLNSDGTFTDSRDGRVYKTVKVGNQVWMAENLQYEIADGSACYNDDSGYCEVFGRLYSWDAATDACPEGWTLPSELDWYALVDEVGDADLRFSQGWAGGMPPKNDYDFAVWLLVMDLMDFSLPMAAPLFSGLPRKIARWEGLPVKKVLASFLATRARNRREVLWKRKLLSRFVV